jgi:hypothetical protein
MNCAQCDADMVVIQGSAGSAVEGAFSEVWACENCGAEGTVTGNAEDNPREWEWVGEVFDDD